MSPTRFRWAIIALIFFITLVNYVDRNAISFAIGDIAHMPYFNQLAASGLVYTNSHGVAHPSLPDYLALYSGSTQGVTRTRSTVAGGLRSTAPSRRTLRTIGEVLP